VLIIRNDSSPFLRGVMMKKDGASVNYFRLQGWGKHERIF